MHRWEQKRIPVTSLELQLADHRCLLQVSMQGLTVRLYQP